ncbi:hypothetical protein P691DRAFT_340589 [Macrolepiota fuliginosa MF-IS2]|uniref:Uncharacterized protein n=1 Tax=Macrolepiota fuliginosa MF-IS2 TaxID=1400762 RepID=A0A9P5X6Y7_9AGAR|nr:hypothetical protein P691DRAFT_340589 [Macrolepiota fuliginosa MF-IS2]
MIMDGTSDDNGNMHDVDDVDDRAGDDQQRRSRNHIPSKRGPNRTQAQIRAFTPSSQISHEDSRSNRHSRKAKHLRKSRVKLDAHEDNYEFNSNQRQSLGSPMRLHQSTPVSDSIDDHHSFHDDNDDGGAVIGVDWTTPWPVLGSKNTHTSANDVLSAQGAVRNARGDASGAESPDLRGTSGFSPRATSRSAMLVGLDAQIQELSAQVDAFRQERETLLNFVAAQRQWQQPHQHQHREREPDGSLSGLGTISRAGADQLDRSTLDEFGAVENEQGTPIVSGNDRGGNEPTDDTRWDALDTLAHRLRVVEDGCLRLRYDLDECRTITQTRENELLESIQALQKRVEELNVLCEAKQLLTTPPLASQQRYESPNLGLASGQDQSRQQQQQQQQQPVSSHPEAESFLILDPTPALVPDTTTEEDDNLPTSHFQGTENPASEAQPHRDHGEQPDHRAQAQAQAQPRALQRVQLGGDDGAEPIIIDITEPLQPRAIATSPPLQPQGQIPWLSLDDSELDGLLDAIDGEASMELATPLMPVSLLECDEDGDGDGGSLLSVDEFVRGVDCDDVDDDGDDDRDSEGCELDYERSDRGCDDEGHHQGEEDLGEDGSARDQRGESENESEGEGEVTLEALEMPSGVFASWDEREWDGEERGGGPPLTDDVGTRSGE